ncbi:MAG TPA: hypothetical protein VGF55_22605 [Gemmataceae bacterium]
MFTDRPAATVTGRPRRRWRVWLLLVGVPVALLVLAVGVWFIRVNGRLQAAIAEADRLDPRWRLEDIEADRFTPPPGQNAADKIVAVRRLTPAKWWDPTKAQLFDDLLPERRLNDQQIAALRELLEPVGPALAEARSLIDTPRGRHFLTYAPIWLETRQPAGDNRDVAALLRYDIFDKAQAGDADGAARSCHAAFHAGCSIGDEPFALSQVVRVAVQAIAVNLLERTLAQGEPSEAVLAALQSRLEDEEPAPLLLYAMRGDRAGIFRVFDNLRNGSVSVTDMLGPLDTLSFENLRCRNPASVICAQTWCLRSATAAVEIAKLPPEQWAVPFAEQGNASEEQFRTGQLGRLHALAGLLITRGQAEIFQRNHALLRCAIVAVAAERYRRAKGHWPATPDELVKAGLLKAVPGDPFAAGQPVKFVRLGDGLVVYSVGQDGTDDGGKLDKDPKKPGTDYGVRLWDVTARRQPPLPPKPADTDESIAKPQAAAAGGPP